MALTADQERDLLQMFTQWQAAKPRLRALERIVHQQTEIMRERGAIDAGGCSELLALYESIRPDAGELGGLGVRQGKKVGE